MTSITASVALRTLGKWTTATVVGRTGASLIVTVSRYQVRCPAIILNEEGGMLTFGDDPQSALRSDEQLCRIKPCR